ncbi:MAG: glutamate synthase subunit beta [Betaproteobacteria bacterium]|jgi:glutamate synthase (NADPH/NADH) small chain|nr:glutamate synthase subunit beta [Betaproteobacteria bacterium]MDH5287263.1 glutamate synthase subunit beta [Betaproteobacteria bacterium]
MGKITGFLELKRIQEAAEPAAERLGHYREFVVALTDAEASRQGARCMDCGIPFCQSGCPISNVIPDWNDLAYRGQWQRALEVLHSTNNFPEFTGRVCPAPCEAACTLNINDDAVGIKSIEHFLVDKGWEEGWVRPLPPQRKTGKRVAVVGSGPAGMACAQQLARAGHDVVLYEKSDRIGGLMRYGIPDFKMEKHLIDRRMAQMAEEGVVFRPNAEVGRDVSARQLLAEHDAVVLAGGAEQPRDLPVPGRELAGVHFAMEFLPQQNRVVAGDAVAGQIKATGKHVVVIGGGDTGSDCVGTSNRHGAASVTQFELLPQPPQAEDKPLTWPYWPAKLRTSSSHEEGCARDWSVATKRFEGRGGKVAKLVAARLEWTKDPATGQARMTEIPGSEFELAADLVLLAMGFTGPAAKSMLEQFGVARDARSNVQANADDYRTSVAKVFAAGDMRRGQSLVVWAIREGRQCARSVDEFLMGSSALPR